MTSPTLGGTSSNNPPTAAISDYSPSIANNALTNNEAAASISAEGDMQQTMLADMAGSEMDHQTDM